MAEMLLDTTVFRDYRGGDPGAREIVEQVMDGKLTASVSAFTIFELWGASGFGRRAEIGYAGIMTFLEQAPLSPEAARQAGLWLASVEGEERERLLRFALVAATALERQERICTRDVEAFSRFYSDVVEY